MKDIYALYGQSNWLGKPNWVQLYLFETEQLALDSLTMHKGRITESGFRAYKICPLPVFNYLPDAW